MKNQINGKLKEVHHKIFNQYINKRDIYGNTPLLLCCQKEQIAFEESNRMNCLRFLIQNQAEKNIFNKITLWSPIFWISYWGDIKSLDLFIHDNLNLFYPDVNGLYALDIAVENEYNNLVGKILHEMINIIEKYKHSSLDDNIDIDKYINSPMARQSMLFHACRFHSDVSIIQRIISIDCNTFIYMPNYRIKGMNIFNFCAKYNNMKAL